MKARLLLAALHFNENTERQQVKSKAGKPRWKVSYPKYNSGPIAQSVKTKQTYARKTRFAAARVYDQAIPPIPEPDPQPRKKRRKKKK
eukprot:gene20925-22980_t